jgi:tRNA G18 (ribose-2'-O)-methylase SpoU
MTAWPTIADARALRDAGLFVAEGARIVDRVLADARLEVVSVLCTPSAAESLRLASRCGSVLEVRSSAEMQDLAGFAFHRGVLALVRRPGVPGMATLLAVVNRGSPVVVAEHLADADNMGSVFRNAWGLGAAAVLLDDRCADPLYRKAVRTSMGAVFDLPWSVAPRGEIHAGLRSAGYRLVALTPAGSAPPLADVVRETTGGLVAIVVGNEGGGLDVQSMAACDLHARIPMAPGADSLNVATALAVALYAWQARR